MELNENEPELALFALITDGDQCEEETTISDNDSTENKIIYFTLNDGDEAVDHNEEIPLSYVIHENNDNINSSANTFLGTEIKLITLGNQQYFYIPPTTDDDSLESSTGPQIANGNFSSDNSNVPISLEANNDEDSLLSVMINEEDLSEIEAELKKFKCLYKGCGKLFSSAELLTIHTKNHVNRKPFLCMYEECDKKFASNYLLTAHIRTHTGEKPYNCQICPRSFKTSSDLMKHVRVHTGEKPFHCPMEGCGKAFTTSNIRKVHVRSHTGERPYVCDYPNCGKAFASSTNHKNHIRIHSGEKPFVCHVKGCDKRFTEYSSLHKHQAVHRVDKPFECDYCKLKFKSEQTLNVHRKVKHGVLLVPEGIQFVDLASVGLPS